MPNLEIGPVARIPCQDQCTFFPVPTEALARKFGVGVTTVRAGIHKIQKTEPDHVMRRGTGTKSRYSITSTGMELLERYLGESLTVGSRKKVNFIRYQDSVVFSSESQAIVSRPPNPNPTLSEAIPLYPTLTRKIQLAIDCLDKLHDASLEEKRILLIIFLLQENVSIQAKKKTAEILGITLETVDETIRKKTSEEVEDRREALFKKFLAIKASVGRNKKTGR